MTQAQKERFIALAVGAAGVLLMVLCVRLEGTIPAALSYAGVIAGGVLLIAAGWIISPRRKKLREKRRAGRANRD